MVRGQHHALRRPAAAGLASGSPFELAGDFSARPAVCRHFAFLLAQRGVPGSPCTSSAPVLDSVTSRNAQFPLASVTRRRGQRCAAAPGVSLRLDRPQARARARVSVCAHVHTYACSRIHPHTHLKPVRPDTADPNPTPELYASVLLSASAMSTSEREEAAPHYA